MKDTNNPVDLLFKESLERHEMPLSKHLWEAIEQKNRKKHTTYWPYMSAAAAILLVFFTGIIYLKWQGSFTDSQIAAIDTIKKTPAIKPAKKPDDAEISNPVAAVLQDLQTNKEKNITKDKTVDEIKPKTVHQKLIENQTSETAQPIVSSFETETLAAAPKNDVTDETIDDKTLPVEVTFISENTTVLPQENKLNSKVELGKKIAKQLWQLKNGHKPDFQEMGLASSYTIELQTKNQTFSKTFNL